MSRGLGGWFRLRAIGWFVRLRVLGEGRSGASTGFRERGAALLPVGFRVLEAQAEIRIGIPSEADPVRRNRERSDLGIGPGWMSAGCGASLHPGKAP